MRIKSYIVYISVLTIFIIGVVSCATVKPEIVEETGIMGVVVPVNKEKEEIDYQERDKIVLNFVPMKNGKSIFNKSISNKSISNKSLSNKSFTINPEKDGSFKIYLEPEEYRLEIFLKGFYVKTVNLSIAKGQLLKLGEIMIQKIEPEPGIPLKGSESEENFFNEGDVNIQQPVY